MSTTVAARRFFDTTVGKKALMALTGVVLFGFLVGHVAGNLQVFAGEEKVNAYAKFLHETTLLLWGTRVVVVGSLALHILMMVQLYKLSRADGRPVGYKKKQNRGASFTSLFMPASGVALGLFFVYHILHFTTGQAHHDFRDVEPYHNMVSAFQRPLIALVYLAAMGFLAVHLAHGLYSFTHSLGVSHPGYAARIKLVAIFVAVLLALAFASIPLLIMTGRFPQA